ncbi:MAG: hypothetical protein HY886_07565 [Deltaproteobacteria bacterium]|nr:hypothetical protein [Deltaproteobacteria bacterium]
MKATTTFNEVLESIAAFSEEEIEMFLEIVEKRLIEDKRERLAKSIRNARKEFASGKTRKGTVDDFIKEMGR